MLPYHEMLHYPKLSLLPFQGNKWRNANWHMSMEVTETLFVTYLYRKKMSLITLIRDYVDVAISTEQLDGYTLSSLTYHILAFLFTVVKQAVFYCFTLGWLRDLSYFCLTPPLLLSSFTNVNGIGDQPLSHLLAFSDSNFSTGIGLVIVGFFNGCFSCMHLSAAHLVTIQRMLVQGVPAGFSSAFGTAIGQFSFLACVLFGFRGLLFPWLALEPLHFLLGTAILLSIASTMAQDRRAVTVQWSNKGSLLSYFFTTFLLAWCEQTAIFQWMGNLSFGAEPTLLEPAASLGNINSVFGNFQLLAQNFGYLFAFFLGSVLGALLIGVFLQRFLEFVLRQKGIAIYYGLVKQANLPLATLVFAFGFGSLPYYGFDYLITKGFGFVPQEPFFQQTFFSPTNLVSKTSQTKEPSQGRLEDQLALLFTLEGERNKSFAVDTTPFDNGQYLKANQKRPQAFEDLNYRGEHLWTNRLSRISNIREQANQTQSSFLGPVFSWMRSFLWGEGPTTIATGKTRGQISDTFSKNSEEIKEHQVTNKKPVDSNKLPTMDFRLRRHPSVSVDGDRKESTTINVSTNSSDNLFDSMFEVENNKRRKELSTEREQLDNYVKEFDRQFDKGFSNFYDTDPHSLIEVEDQWQEKRIKNKCYTNPIYKFLLNTEIDSFLARQPRSFLLSPQDEILLLKKRQLLSNYYDTLSFTNQVSKSEALEQLVPKSYANVIYNHQFKGTLKVARRLFSVKQGPAKQPLRGMIGSTNTEIMNAFDEGEKSSRTVTFDQPLFSKENANVQQTVFHEELSIIEPSDDSNSADQVITLDKKESRKGVLPKKEDIFSLDHAETSPLYAGWDEQLRKFTITNRFQSRALAGYTSSRLPASYKNGDHPSGYDKTTIFTTWPIPNPLVIKNKNDFLSTPTKQEIGSENSYPEGINNSLSLKDNFVADNDSLDTKNLLIKSTEHSNVKRTHLNERNDQVNGFSKKDGGEATIDSINKSLPFLSQTSKNRFLFQTKFHSAPATNDMVNALLQWQKLIKENKQLSKEDKQAAKEKISHWPENIHRAYWSNEPIDNELELDEPTENFFKKQTFLWEFTPPYHGGFIWSGKNWNN